MKSYLNLIKHVMEEGVHKSDRTGTGTVSVFSPPAFRHTFNSTYKRDASGKEILSVNNFPLLTTKNVKFKDIAVELMWFLAGDTNIKFLVDYGVNIWVDWPLKYYNSVSAEDQKLSRSEFIKLIRTNDEFAMMHGDCGPVYGKQWRDWFASNNRHIDQIADVVQQLRTNPDSRRMIVNAWNVGDIPGMIISGLPPCHTMFQFYTAEREDGARNLSLKMYQRSH